MGPQRLHAIVMPNEDTVRGNNAMHERMDAWRRP